MSLLPPLWNCCDVGTALMRYQPSVRQLHVARPLQIFLAIPVSFTCKLCQGQQHAASENLRLGLLCKLCVKLSFCYCVCRDICVRTMPLLKSFALFWFLFKRETKTILLKSEEKSANYNCV